MIIRIVVVFPAPLGPMKPYSPPRGTSRSRSATATVRPNAFLTPVIRTAASMTADSTPDPARASPPAGGVPVE